MADDTLPQITVTVHTRGYWVRQRYGMPEYAPGFSTQYASTDSLPSFIADHVFDMLRAGHLSRDTGLEVILLTHKETNEPA